MRTLSPLLAAVLLAAVPGGAAIGFAQAQTYTCPPSGGEAGAYTPRIIADEAPPPLPEYDQPPLPAPGYIWTPGYWNWNNEDYYWVPGTWIEPPRPGLLWTPGYWGFVNGAYMFHRGYWGPRVGFYGGVAYGFGYFGNGFEGGRWDGDRFFYNRTVNNFGSVHIVNVYERPAPRIVERVSFNGGPEGVKARPTPEQIAAEKEKHIPPTVDQRRNVRAASRNEAAFVTVNKGKPPVAATQKPGDFKGAVVAPARAAGGPIKARPLDEATPGGAEDQKGKPELKGEKPEAQRPELKGEKPEAKPEAMKPEPKDEKPQVRQREPKGEKPEARKHEPKADKPDAQKDEPKAGKPEARKHEPKAERPEAKPMKPEARPEPKAEPRPEKPRPEHAKPERAEPQHPKPEHAGPEPRQGGEGHAACHPGEAHCAK
jgi:hypothetical protein